VIEKGRYKSQSHTTISVEKFVTHNAMKRKGTSSSIRHPFFTLIVHLLWDSRTNIVLRTIVASALIRFHLMSSQNGSHGDKSIEPNIGIIVGYKLLWCTVFISSAAPTSVDEDGTKQEWYKNEETETILHSFTYGGHHYNRLTNLGEENVNKWEEC
jgi:hypothetical protein